MQIKYSPDADILIIKLRESKPTDSRNVAEGIIAHYSKDKKIIEIKILDISKVVQLKDVRLSIKGLKAVKA